MAEASTPSGRSRQLLKNVVFQPDLALGLVLGIGVGLWTGLAHHFRRADGSILAADIGAAAALLAVTLAALALILGLVQSFYKRLIENDPRDFFRPFRVLAVVSAGAVVAAILASVDASDTQGEPFSSILFGIANGALAWAVGTTVQLTSQLARMTGRFVSANAAIERAESEAQDRRRGLQDKKAEERGQRDREAAAVLREILEELRLRNGQQGA